MVGTGLENKLFKVIYADGHEVYESDNVLFHPCMTEESFSQLVQEAFNEINRELPLKEIEDYLVKTYHFQKIECVVVNTRDTLKDYDFL